MNSAVDLLRQVELFDRLTDEQLEALSAQSRLINFKKNAIIMTEGETGQSMYVIKSGRVKVFVSGDDGRELIIYQQGKGAVIGDIALLDDEPRSASVSTLEATTALTIGKEAFLNTLLQSPEMAINIIRSLTQRLRDATEGSRSLALNNVYQRLADKLEELSEPNDDGQLALSRKYSHQELGNMIGASREMVGKVLAELLKGDYVAVEDGQLKILKKFPKNW